MNKEQNHNQPKVTGGTQKVILDERETKETDELNPDFKKRISDSEIEKERPEPGDDPSSELI